MGWFTGLKESRWNRPKLPSLLSFADTTGSVKSNIYQQFRRDVSISKVSAKILCKMLRTPMDYIEMLTSKAQIKIE